ncbi:unnamed protein product [Soboliphyme baturini]|uniref:Charged multivesicular body protein 7 n=1 Tax=Soboliphyme baturini TaxID=241478 RepID=A0A183J6K0_9BILA|nr:unnamed protein product [Soboliphyme baturini]
MDRIPDLSKESYFPPGWNDDEKMSNLLAAFKSRDLNPQNYDAKMNFWVEAVESSCRRLCNPVITCRELKARFRRNTQIPAGMIDVIKHMCRVGKLVPQKVFENRNQGWMSWAIEKLIKNPYCYFFNYRSDDQDDVNAAYVLPEILQDISDKVMEVRQNADMKSPLYDDLVSMRVFQNAVKPYCANEKVFDMVVQNLIYRKQLTIGVSGQGEKIVKFKARNENGPVKITDLDRTVHSMKGVVEKLEQEMLILEEQANRLESEARKQIQMRNRTKAKTYLRQKQVVTKRLNDREKAYSNMLSLIDRLTQSDDNKVVSYLLSFSLSF